MTPNEQKLADHLSNASWLLSSARKQHVGLGFKCEKCGQEPQLYRGSDLFRVLMCSSLYWEMSEGRYSHELSFMGFKFDQPVQCGRDLALELRMRHCWFPEAA